MFDVRLQLNLCQTQSIKLLLLWYMLDCTMLTYCKLTVVPLNFRNAHFPLCTAAQRVHIAVWSVPADSGAVQLATYPSVNIDGGAVFSLIINPATAATYKMCILRTTETTTD